MNLSVYIRTSALKKDIKAKGVFFEYENELKDVLTHRRLETYLKEKAERHMIIILLIKKSSTTYNYFYLINYVHGRFYEFTHIFLYCRSKA